MYVRRRGRPFHPDAVCCASQVRHTAQISRAEYAAGLEEELE